MLSLIKVLIARGIYILRGVIIAVLAAVSAYSLWSMGRLAFIQFVRPILYYDSWVFTQRPLLSDWKNFLVWLVSQFDYHRLVISRIVSVLETELLRVPPASTALIQSLILLIFSSVLIFMAVSFIRCRKTRLITWLLCNAILFNPWQSQNLWWEYQSPWFFVNALVLLVMFILVRWAQVGLLTRRHTYLLGFSIIPWLAIYASGQGICFALALCVVSFFFSRRLAIAVFSSTALAVFVYYFILPDFHPIIRPFNFMLLVYMLSGGVCRGMAYLCLGVGILLAMQFVVKKKVSSWLPVLALSLPALYAFFCALIISLTRSVFSASETRYVTLVGMIPLSAVLISAWLHEKIHANSGENAVGVFQSLIPVAIVVFTLVFPLPQALTNSRMNYISAWQKIVIYRQEMGERFVRCLVAQATAVGPGNPHLPASCVNEKYFFREAAIPYLTGKRPLKPLGWHKQLLEAEMSGR